MSNKKINREFHESGLNLLLLDKKSKIEDHIKRGILSSEIEKIERFSEHLQELIRELKSVRLEIEKHYPHVEIDYNDIPF